MQAFSSSHAPTRHILLKMARSLLLLCCVMVGLSACSSPPISVYEQNSPSLIVREFFDGTLLAHGIVKNRRGEVIRYFNASILATWDEDGRGWLDESFIFDDGEKQQRVWELRPLGNNQYIASANDVVGESPLHAAGNALFLNYRLRLARNDGSVDVNVDDRMYLVNEKTLINESTLSKFGFTVGRVTLVIRKE